MKLYVLAILGLLQFPIGALGQEGQQQFAVLGDFRLESGEQLRNLRLVPNVRSTQQRQVKCRSCSNVVRRDHLGFPARVGIREADRRVDLLHRRDRFSG